MSLLPTIILCCTDGPRSGKQINWPPTYLGLPYYPLPPPMYRCSPLKSLHVPQPVPYQATLFSEAKVHQTIWFPSFSFRVNVLRPGSASPQLLRLNHHTFLILPLLVIYPGRAYPYLSSFLPTNVFKPSYPAKSLPSPASPSKPLLIFPLHILPGYPQEPTFQPCHFCSMQDSHPEADLSI